MRQSLDWKQVILEVWLSIRSTDGHGGSHREGWYTSNNNFIPLIYCFIFYLEMYDKVVLLFKLVAGDENTAGAPVKGAATRWQSEPTSTAF